MRTINSIGAVCVFLLCPYHGMYGQDNEQTCKEKVIYIYQHLNTLNRDASDDQQVHYRYTTKVLMRDSVKNHNTKTDAQVTIGKNKIELISPQGEVYQDEHDAFSVLPSKKIILWADSQIGGKNAFTSNLLKLQDTLIETSVLQACDMSNGVQKITLGIDRQRQRFEYNALEFWIDSKESVFKKIVVYYPENSRLYAIEYLFHDIAAEPLNTEFGKTARERIFSDADRLEAKYNGYRVLDSRASKKQ